MKITQENKFQPVTIMLEDEDDHCAMVWAMGIATTDATDQNPFREKIARLYVQLCGMSKGEKQ